MRRVTFEASEASAPWWHAGGAEPKMVLRQRILELLYQVRRYVFVFCYKYVHVGVAIPGACASAVTSCVRSVVAS